MGVGLGLHEACTGLAQGLAWGWHGNSVEWQRGGMRLAWGGTGVTWGLHGGGTGVAWGLHGACVNLSSRMQQSTPAVGCC